MGLMAGCARRVRADVRGFFIGLLTDAPFRVFRWETPPITRDTAERPFEFVLLDSPDLIKAPDTDAFAEHFRGARGSEVIEFSNLGGDAHMVVPRPVGPHSAYAHLGDFVRNAPAAQIPCVMGASRPGHATADR